MKRFATLALILMMLLLAPGCCTCRGNYEPALKQWEENLDRLRPTMEKGAKTLPEDLGQTKMDLYDRTVQGIQRVRGEGPEVFAEKKGDK